MTEVLKAHLATIKPGDYIAFLNYIEQTPEIDRMFQELRTELRDATKCAVTIGYGPRFLHSTGQLHKGGPDTGVFFQIIANDETDFAVPGEPYTFTILKQAQDNLVPANAAVMYNSVGQYVTQLREALRPYFWLEGERAASHNFSGISYLAGSSGGTVLRLDRHEAPVSQALNGPWAA